MTHDRDQQAAAAASSSSGEHDAQAVPVTADDFTPPGAVAVRPALLCNKCPSQARWLSRPDYGVWVCMRCANAAGQPPVPGHVVGHDDNWCKRGHVLELSGLATPVDEMPHATPVDAQGAIAQHTGLADTCESLRAQLARLEAEDKARADEDARKDAERKRLIAQLEECNRRTLEELNAARERFSRRDAEELERQRAVEAAERQIREANERAEHHKRERERAEERADELANAVPAIECRSNTHLKIGAWGGGALSLVLLLVLIFTRGSSAAGVFAPPGSAVYDTVRTAREAYLADVPGPERDLWRSLPDEAQARLATELRDDERAGVRGRRESEAALRAPVRVEYERGSR